MPSQLPNPPSHAFRHLALSLVLGFVGVLCFAAYQLLGSYRQAEAQAEQSAQRLALTLESYLNAHFQTVDLTLAAAAADYTELHRQQRFSDAEFNHQLQALRRRLPLVSGLRAADARGLVRHG